MRLINATSLTIETFFNKAVQQYAMLSHTWGDDEVTLQDMEAGGGRAQARKAYVKIRRICEQALRDHLNYVWIDTCCIDKTSSPELSEAINSMFTWYHRAWICYAFLVDVLSDTDPHDSGRELDSALLVLCRLVFNASDWSPIAPRRELILIIATATGIDEDTMRQMDLNGLQLLSCTSIAERMSWAATRRTTQVEDIAYCLLGIFGVNMPLLYGEGERAFLRLQEEIIKRSADELIFAWNCDATRPWVFGILAVSPACFAGCGDIIQCKG
ncbi:heterokaryon incompatibility protein-domain-containing protein [Aspergillus ambiguus]|uniref:heterokaryon incompatibility protein-domain-containing protein n=1 Tax=Aspergillus ambiguus TaxID=176160 RepID=UPI003CCD1521